MFGDFRVVGASQAGVGYARLHGVREESGEVSATSSLEDGKPPILLLGGSGVVISGVISPLIRVISIVTLVITLLITTHEPPSSVFEVRVVVSLDLQPFRASSMTQRES